MSALMGRTLLRLHRLTTRRQIMNLLEELNRTRLLPNLDKVNTQARNSFLPSLHDYHDRFIRYTPMAVAVWMVVLTLAPHSQFRLVHVVFHYSLLPLLFGIHMFLRAVRPKAYSPLCWGWQDLSMGVYLIFTLVSYFWADGKSTGVILHVTAVYRNIFVPFVVFWLIRLTQTREDQIKSWVPVMAFLCLVNVIVSILAWFWPEMLPKIWRGFLVGVGEVRITGTFTEPGIFNSAVLFFSTFIFQYAVTLKKGWLRSLCMSLCSLGLVCIFLSFQRASWFALILLIVMAALLYGRAVHPFDSIGLLTGGVLLIFTLTVPPEVLKKQANMPGTGQREVSTPKMINERISSTSQIRSRIITGHSGIRMFLEKPLWGWGYETYNLHSRRFVSPVGSLKVTEYEKRTTSHNTFITFLAETGLVGFFLYLFPIGWWLIVSIRTHFQLQNPLSSGEFLNRRFFVMLCANLGFILINSQFFDIRFFPFTLVQIWLILGLISNFAEGRYLVQQTNNSKG